MPTNWTPESPDERAARLARIETILAAPDRRVLQRVDWVPCLPPRGPIGSEQNRERQRVVNVLKRQGFVLGAPLRTGSKKRKAR